MAFGRKTALHALPFLALYPPNPLLLLEITDLVLYPLLSTNEWHLVAQHQVPLTCVEKQELAAGKLSIIQQATNLFSTFRGLSVLQDSAEILNYSLTVA